MFVAPSNSFRNLKEDSFLIKKHKPAPFKSQTQVKAKISLFRFPRLKILSKIHSNEKSTDSNLNITRKESANDF